MNNIIYRRIDYTSKEDKNQILDLYKRVFNVEFADEYDFWFCQERKPIGIVAVCKNKIVGHFTTILQEAVIQAEIINFRLSMGFMTDSMYRGKGIAGNLYKCLKEELLQENDALFLMGFPNDVSYCMHLEKLEYEHIKDFSFVTIPHEIPNNVMFNLMHDNEWQESCERDLKQNCLYHSDKYLRWRYSLPKYGKYVSEEGKKFIVTKYGDKIDILYWDTNVEQNDVLQFVGFLYQNFNVSKVTTWNSVAFLNQFPEETRKYHMCINFFNCNENQKKQIEKEWIFFMGDCELF